MASTNPSQLFFLADHIKLSLLERQRAHQLNLPANSQDTQISRSLDQLTSGIEALARQLDLTDSNNTDNNNDNTSTPLRPSPERDQLAQLQQQCTELTAQFGGGSSGDRARAHEVLTTPNNAALQADFDAAQRKERGKNVRFQDQPTTTAAAAAAGRRSELFPYRDDPDAEDEDGVPDHGHLDNQQIHDYHSNVMAEQDEQLDMLGHSIGRQRELTIAMGNELDEQIVMLDEVDGQVDRHQNQINGAQKRLNNIMKKAKQNWSMTTIVVLIIVLVLLIVLTK